MIELVDSVSNSLALSLTTNYFLMHLLGQIIGIIGFAVSVAAFLQKKDKGVKTLLGVSASLAAVSYYLTGAYTGAAIISVSAVRNFLSARGGKLKKLYPVFITINIILGVYIYKNPYDLLPILGALTSTTSVFKLEGMRFRVGMLSACILWLIYNIITFSIGPIMMEIFNSCALCYAICRIKKGRKPQHDVKSE